MRILTHKTEFYPNRDQVQMIDICFGLRRKIFNLGLIILRVNFGKDLKENIRGIRKSFIKYDIRKDIRDNFHHLTSLGPSQIVDTALEDLSAAVDSLRGKRKKNKAGLEIKLRTKKKSPLTFRIQRKNPGSFAYECHNSSSSYLKLPRIGFLKLAEPLRYSFNDNIKTVTIRKQAERYFISITMETEEGKIFPKTNKHIAFDYGIKTFLTGYDGEEHVAVDFDRGIMDKLDKNIRRKHKKLSNRKQNSKSWMKAKTKLESAYLNRVSYQNDFLHKLSTELAEIYDGMTLEDLNMSFMIRNRSLAKKASENMYYRFKVFCYNKFIASGKVVYLSNRNFPSTQICSSCGYIKSGEEKMKLEDRDYNCPNCGTVLDRDMNAAKNLFNNRELTVFSV